MIHTCEADLDFGNPPAVLDKLAAAQFVISMSAFDHPTTRDYADLLLPISPFTETAGTFVNLEGLPQDLMVLFVHWGRRDQLGKF